MTTAITTTNGRRDEDAALRGVAALDTHADGREALVHRVDGDVDEDTGAGEEVAPGAGQPVGLDRAARGDGIGASMA